MVPSVFAGDGPNRQTPAWRSPPAHWRLLSVLVVDDHQTYRALMGWFLQKFELAHVLVENGQAALSTMAHRRFDLVISDCRMPVMDGYSMTREIRHRERTDGRERVPVIALTGKLGPDDARRCLEAGMDDWLLKPLSQERLREVLERWLPQRPGEVRHPFSEAPQKNWPTRAGLIEMFGDGQVVDLMLGSLLREADSDYASLVCAFRKQDRQGTLECLHRLAGSLAFLGGTDLDTRAGHLIDRVRDHGVLVNRRDLQRFEKELIVYLRYLADL
ncbi:response regulator [Pseudomonas sp. TH32]|uniref:Hpt domain-containing response regulator n=1 Tax=Pseudomonas sp. TH32 TaxID=2796397 RepID=UPI0019127648|nr:response regulator [Pseudomonas sp. TH32]MBK5439640.1 response regulator [Pseudomonas sp. TH32]